MRTCLILFLLLGPGLGLTSRWIQEVRKRGEAQRAMFAKPTSAVPKRGNRVTVTYATEKSPSWLTRMVRATVHPEYERRLDRIEIFGSRSDFETASNIANVFDVHSISCMGRYPEAWLAKAVSARGLRSLTLGGQIKHLPHFPPGDHLAPPADLESLRVTGLGSVRPEFVQWLCRAPKLKRISIDRVDPASLPCFANAPHVVEMTLQTSINGNAGRFLLLSRSNQVDFRYDETLGEFFDNLSGRGELKSLCLQSVTLHDPECIKGFCKKSKITSLKLAFCNISPLCLEEFSKLKSVTSLDLGVTALADVDLPILAQMTGLREIKNLWCSDDVAEAYLQAALPKCKITGNPYRPNLRRKGS